MPVFNKSRFNDPVTSRMHQVFVRFDAALTVGEALERLRTDPPPTRIHYFYVADADGRLVGVVPARRLLSSPADSPLSDVMIRKVITLPARATVLEACEFFIQYPMLGFPIVDADDRMLGVVDVDLYADEISRLKLRTPVGRLLQPFARFLQIQSASGVVLLLCAIAALVIANSAWSGQFQRFWQTQIGVKAAGFELNKPLLLWINDGLMSLFFFVAGLEIKRELVAGELSHWKKALLPIVAALGGMVAPALVYLLLQWGRPTSAGWGIPVATDIAFVVGFLALLGSRVPHSLKIMLLSLAIADDIGATLVIALVYSSDISWTALAVGAGGFALVLILRWIGVRRVGVYIIPGIVIWVAFVKSGVHPSVAAVALGLLTPARGSLTDRMPFDFVTDVLQRFTGVSQEEEVARRDPISPLERIQRDLHPWVAFLIMPLFALANAGVAVQFAELGRPVAIAVAFGLILGKPLGIFLFSWGTAKIGWTRLPNEINPKVLVGAGCLAGIGFTMSLFIANLALKGNDLNEAKVGILTGSAISAILGSALLIWFLPKVAKKQNTDHESTKVRKHEKDD